MSQISNLIRKAALLAGMNSGERFRRVIRSVNGQFEVGDWLRSQGTRKPKEVSTKEELFGAALAELTHRSEPLYLEFGVYQGGSMRWWLENLSVPGARFVGFDSFQGLPQFWIDGFEKGHFATDIPSFEDPRAHLEIGFFTETLPNFTIPHSDQMMVNFDADLYTSTQTVLQHVMPKMRTGDLLYFDEFHLGEQRALSDYLASSQLQVEPIGVTINLACWLFRVIDSG